MKIRLAAGKLSQVKEVLRSWGERNKCTKRELLSVIGLLAFASKVVKPGRFLRRLIDLSTTVSSLDHFIYLNLEARADISWWAQFLPDWPRVEIIHPTPIMAVELRLFIDASDLGLCCMFGPHWVSPWLEQSTPLRALPH